MYVRRYYVCTVHVGMKYMYFYMLKLFTLLLYRDLMGTKQYNEYISALDSDIEYDYRVFSPVRGKFDTCSTKEKIHVVVIE
jgi:hypothetical protein